MEPWAFIFQLIPLGWRQCPAAVDPVKHSNKPRLLLSLARTFLGADDKVTNVRSLLLERMDQRIEWNLRHQRINEEILDMASGLGNLT